MRLDYDLRLKALDLFERGFSYKAVAHQLQLSPETVREWVYLWRALGSDRVREVLSRYKSRYVIDGKDL